MNERNQCQTNKSSANKDITTVKAFKFNPKMEKNPQIPQLQNFTSQDSFITNNPYHLASQLMPSSKSTTVKKDCFELNNGKSQCCGGCKNQSKQNHRDKLAQNQYYDQNKSLNYSRRDSNGSIVNHTSQRQNSSYMNTPIINMEQKFREQSESNMNSILKQNNNQIQWNEYQDNPKIIVQCSPLSSMKQSMRERKSSNNYQNSNLTNQTLHSQNSTEEKKLTTIESLNSLQSSMMDKNSISKPLSVLQQDYIENSNNINISKLSDNFLLNANSALSKNSIASSSGFGNMIHLSCNSNSNFFLNHKALIEQKHGMFASAELTQGIDNGSSNYMGDDHQRSNSSLPMFSPLKESDLFQSKKITPRTYMQNNYLLNQSKLLQSQYGNKESQFQCQIIK
eukprot:403357588